MHRYQNVVELIRRRIGMGVLKVGDRLPSVRKLSKETGFSVLTVYHAYEILESQGVCEARDRSGFYVSSVPSIVREFPEVVPHSEGLARSIGNLPEAQILSWEKRRLYSFGSFQPATDLFKRENLDRAVRRVLRRGADRNDAYNAPDGDRVLRHAIALRSAQRGIISNPSEIVVARSGMDAFNLCLDMFAEPLTTVLVESPSYFPMLASMKRRNLMALELYSHPKTGVDPEQFEYLLRTTGVKVCVLMAANHFPTGVTYSRESMMRIVKAAHDAGAVIIENDMFGKLGYSSERGSSLKEFDQNGTVVQIGSFATFLSPAYGLGWILAGPHAEALLANQYFSGLQVGDGMIQRAIGEYLEEHSHSKHLRKIRNSWLRGCKRVWN